MEEVSRDWIYWSEKAIWQKFAKQGKNREINLMLLLKVQVTKTFEMEVYWKNNIYEFSEMKAKVKGTDLFCLSKSRRL